MWQDSYALFYSKMAETHDNISKNNTLSDAVHAESMNSGDKNTEDVSGTFFSSPTLSDRISAFFRKISVIPVDFSSENIRLGGKSIPPYISFYEGNKKTGIEAMLINEIAEYSGSIFSEASFKLIRNGIITNPEEMGVLLDLIIKEESGSSFLLSPFLSLLTTYFPDSTFSERNRVQNESRESLNILGKEMNLHRIYGVSRPIALLLGSEMLRNRAFSEDNKKDILLADFSYSMFSMHLLSYESDKYELLYSLRQSSEEVDQANLYGGAGLIDAVKKILLKENGIRIGNQTAKQLLKSVSSHAFERPAKSDKDYGDGSELKDQSFSGDSLYFTINSTINKSSKTGVSLNGKSAYTGLPVSSNIVYEDVLENLRSSSEFRTIIDTVNKFFQINEDASRYFSALENTDSVYVSGDYSFLSPILPLFNSQSKSLPPFIPVSDGQDALIQGIKMINSETSLFKKYAEEIYPDKRRLHLSS